ncbi:MAG: hypothetical protein F6K04_20995 [Leptolyngbya sp. SIO4C5]|nr:hypothetical protein [Leptolyngbya sp. SIO4C5]
MYKASPSLQHYFYSLQKHVGFSPDSFPQTVYTPPLRRLSALARTAQSLTTAVPKRRYRADVVVCGIWLWARQQEDELIIRLLQSLLQQDIQILCLLHKGISVGIARKLQQATTGQSLPGRLDFLDPAGRLGRLDARFHLGMARQRSRKDFERVRQILAPHGIYVYDSALPEFEWAAARLMEWEAWAPQIEFETAIVRCHWLPLCSAVAQTGLQRHKKVVTLQQGVVGHSLDIPILAHQYLCFGDSSAQLLSQMESTFADATQRETVCQEYVPVGSLFDPVVDLSHNFSRKTVLILDQSTRWATHLYGLAEQEAALRHLVMMLCQQATDLKQVIVRPHPAAADRQQWPQIAAQFPDRCEISAAAYSLTDDLRRASVTVSLFSGASVIAAASGLPSFFVSTPNGYYTQDLACCASQFLPPEKLSSILAQLCTSETFYADWQAQCRQQAAAYYAQNQTCRFDPALIKKILAKDICD